MTLNKELKTLDSFYLWFRVFGVSFPKLSNTSQVLIQKETAHIDWEKGAEISILVNKIPTQWWPFLSLRSPNKLYMYYIYTLLFSCNYNLFCCWFNKKLELHLIAVSILKITFGLAKIKVPKIGIPMSKTACINPCLSTCETDITWLT